MEVTRSLGRHGTVMPTAYSLLASLPKGTLQHAEHGLRAPGAIYNLSVGRVVRAFAATLDEHDALARAHDHGDGRLGFEGKALIPAQSELLESMVAHIDDAYQILKACHPPQPQVNERFADRWLAKAGHPSVRRFKNAVSPYRQLVAAIVNRVKHEHGQLRFVVFSDGEPRIGGYYLEEVDRDGVLGPDRNIHPGDTAFSFNRDLRFHFVHLYEIGQALNEALLVAFRAQGIRPSGRPAQNASASLVTVAERVAALDMNVFPDEVSKPTPQVLVRKQGEEVEVSVRYPSLATFRHPNIMRVSTIVHGDGHSRQYRVPYFGRDLGVFVKE